MLFSYNNKTMISNMNMITQKKLTMKVFCKIKIIKNKKYNKNRIKVPLPPPLCISDFSKSTSFGQFGVVDSNNPILFVSALIV